jgi:hypothetical protein
MSENRRDQVSDFKVVYPISKLKKQIHGLKVFSETGYNFTEE